MQEYLEAHNYDVVIMPHLFPAEILTFLKRRAKRVPKTVFIATDYSCIPFTEETDCDRYVIPSDLLKDDFIRRGIPEEKLLPLGIPVSRDFSRALSQAEAKAFLSLEPELKYILLSGGSMGAGSMAQTVKRLSEELKKQPGWGLIVICGSNNRLYGQLSELYSSSSRIKLVKRTPYMAWYLKACDVFITKPGGLSSTEAAVSGVPIIHVSPIPGCESINMRFFTEHHMSLDGGKEPEQLLKALDQALQKETAENIISSQSNIINKNAASQICAALNEL